MDNEFEVLRAPLLEKEFLLTPVNRASTYLKLNGRSVQSRNVFKE
jgi:hypothetical protein